VSRTRVALDVSAALVQGAGVGRFVRDLWAALEALPDGPEILPFATRDAGPTGGRGAPGLAGPPRAAPRRLALGTRGWRLAAMASHVTRVPLARLLPAADLVHGPDVVVPHLGRTPSVVTVHDLSFVRFPHLHTPANRALLAAILPHVVRRARLLSADSRATARDLIELCRADPARVRVVYPGCDLERFSPRATPAGPETLARYGVRAPFVLFVGTLEPRKNLPRLVEAFERVAAAGAPHALVLAGAPGWGHEPLLARVAASPARERIVLAGRVAEDDLAPLYRAADALVYPSLHEGFGLPVLEAMACGTPVAAGDASSLPEVVGEAGLLVPAEDVAAIATAIERLIGDSALRERLGRDGPERARRFAWPDTARAMADSYAEAAGTV
jgi:glycosyltransferase involved in cell wall biosynthesis